MAVDPVRKCLYMTEDAWNGEDGRFYRFTPTSYPDLSSGKLEAAKAANAGGTGAISWVLLDATKLITQANAAGAPRTRARKASGTTTASSSSPPRRTTRCGASIPRHRGSSSSTKGATTSPLKGVDNCVVSRTGDLLIAEDGGDMELVMVTPDGAVAPFLRVFDQDHSEIAGPAFDPSGNRLYFSSMRANGTELGSDGGVTYEVRGPFRTLASAPGAGTTATTSSSTTSTTALASALGAGAERAAELPATGAPSGLAVLGLVAGATAAAIAGLARAGVTETDDAVYHST